MNKKDDILVTILGSGTCVPSLERSSCSLLLSIRDKKLLFDFGSGTMRRLLEAKVKIFDLSFVFISHFHPDHTGELASFLFAVKYPEYKKRKTPFTIIAGKGFLDFFKRLKSVYGKWIELEPEILDIIELSNISKDKYDFGDFKLETCSVEHGKESIAFRINCSNGISIVYSGDTDYSENLVGLAKDADIFICESAHPDKSKVKGHLTPSLAGKIASSANVRKLVLTHFYPECDGFDIESQCRKTYSGKLILAKDLMKIRPG